MTNCVSVMNVCVDDDHRITKDKIKILKSKKNVSFFCNQNLIVSNKRIQEWNKK